jgi:hypothetical protein
VIGYAHSGYAYSQEDNFIHSKLRAATGMEKADEIEDRE